MRIGGSALAPEFPLRFVDEQGSSHLLSDVAAVETMVEFVDDTDPPYRCHDAQGRRVRLIVWILELLVCQVVPDDFDTSRLRIGRTPDVDGEDPVLVECVDDLVLRTLGGTPLRFEPATWSTGTSTSVDELVEETGVVPEAFHQLWMKARLGKRFP
ncbi:hypothetical protein [Micromonospora sp. NBC_01796]|uniref:hypothetical protein n=1 Tax=Micromonospora sp. NBC_01796 TaxID=2975987 RepID=UPI002DD88C2C|nr:hypothetical protein [Micromonospora sp. NBC_01796]WSA84238.1 hypothetical protein OIE47_28335 [Micromonospora sp. NBC_01796]